jgi:hypothetical protein
MANPWDRPQKAAPVSPVANEAPVAEEPKASETTTMQALIGGAGKGATANWQDELEGVEAASGTPEWTKALGPLGHLSRLGIGAARLPFDKGAQDQYAETRDAARAKQKLLEKEHPVASTIGELGGALLTPGGKVGTVGQALKAGAIYGGVGGLGEGEGLEDSLVKGGTGTVVGGALGAGLQKGMQYAGKGLGWVSDKLSAPFKNMKDPEAFAIEKFARTAQDDIAAGRALTPEQIEVAAKYGLPIMGGDLGGRKLHTLGRVAGDMSEDAAAMMGQSLAERTAERPQYFQNFLESFTQAPNVRQAQRAINQAAKPANKAAYDVAIEQGSQGFKSKIIDDLMTAPDMQDAVVAAGRTMKNSLAAGRASKAYHELQDGTKVPTLEFMDKVKQKLDDAYQVADRAGEKSKAGDILGLKNNLVEELDRLFPAYKDARGISAEFFKVGNAAEAGKEIFGLLNSRKLMDAGLMEMLPKMKSAERGMVASGLITSMIDAVRADPKAINTILKPKGPQAKEVLDQIIGPRKRAELETMLLLDNHMNMLNQRVTGNSLTAQLASFGKKAKDELAFSGAGMLGASFFGGSVNPFDPMSWPGVALGSVAKRGQVKFMNGVNEKFANKIAQLVVSQDPADFRKAAQLVAKQPWAKRALQENYNKAIKVATPNVGGVAAGPLKITVGPKMAPADDENK